jgi:regulatory protein
MGKENKKENKKLEMFLEKAKHLCSRQEKCKSEIAKKLEEWNAPESLYEKIIAALENEKYIDESRYSVSYVRSKFKQNKWGRIKIKYALQQKKIPDEMIQGAINSEIPKETYEECIYHLLENKKRGLKGDHRMKKLAKLISFGTSKGFEYEIVKKTAEKIIAN